MYPRSDDAFRLEAATLMGYLKQNSLGRIPTSPCRTKGFTLIELMVVFMVTLVLASVALSSYSKHIDRSNRVEAQSRMLEIAMQLERAFTLTGSYPAALPPTVDLSVPKGSTATTQRYLLKYETASNGFKLTSTPKNSQLDDVCGELTLDEANVKKAAGTQTIRECWGQ
jgi:type IV pilus assembly protein PilE